MGKEIHFLPFDTLPEIPRGNGIVNFDSTYISAGVEHELVNVGEDTALVLVVYGSPDVDRTFAATGETVAIGSDGDRFTA